METSQEKLYTADDLWELSRDGKSRELVRGKIIDMAPTGGLHGIIAARITLSLLNFVDEHQVGYVTAAETGFVLATNPFTVRGADVAFISKTRLKPPIPQKYIPMAPDLAVEVVSPGDSESEILDKVKLYFSAGTRLVWVVYPDTKTAYVYHAARNIEVIELTGILDGGDVLPGFKVPMQDIFRDLES